MSDESGTPRLPRQIADRVHWLGACGVSTKYGGVIHIHKSNYVVLGENATLLVDTAVPPEWPRVEPQLDRILAGRQLDWVFPTHPEPAHASNLPNLLEKFPAARVTGDLRDLHLYFPRYADRFVPRRAGDSLDLGGGTRIKFLEPAFKDLPATLWAYEERDRVLFTADGFAYAHHYSADGSDEPYHLEGECALTSSELIGAIAPQQMAFVLKAALYWSRFVEVTPLFANLERMLEANPPAVVAPAHGNVVVDLDDVMPVMKEAYRLAYDA
jgi:flavorubredoxin